MHADNVRCKQQPCATQRFENCQIGTPLCPCQHPDSQAGGGKEQPIDKLPEGMENLTELKTIDVKGNPFDDGTKVQTIRRFGEDVKIKID